MITSDVKPSQVSPPSTLSLPPIIDAEAPINPCGRGARSVQFADPGRSVSTEERKPLTSFCPPTTTSACAGMVNLTLFMGGWGRGRLAPTLTFLCFAPTLPLFYFSVCAPHRRAGAAAGTFFCIPSGGWNSRHPRFPHRSRRWASAGQGDCKIPR